MAVGIWLKASGGVDETEITARAEDVLVGKTTIDDNGEIVQGEITIRYHGDLTIGNIPNTSLYYELMIEEGYYRGESDGKVHLRLSRDSLATFLGIDANTILKGTTIAGISGKIPNDYNISNNKGIIGYTSNNNDGEIYMYFKAGAYGNPYNKNDRSASVRHPMYKVIDEILASANGKRKLAEKLGIRSDKILSGATMCGVAGIVPIPSYNNEHTTEIGINETYSTLYVRVPTGVYGSPYNEVDHLSIKLPRIVDKMKASSKGREALINGLGIRSDKMLSGTTVAGVAGAIPDNTTRTSNGNVAGVNSRYPDVPVRLKQGVVEVSRNTDGVDRFTVCPPRGYYNGNSYVGVPVDEVARALLSDGYSVFKNATFDGHIISGVATGKSIEVNDADVLSPSFRYGGEHVEYKGIASEGLSFNVSKNSGDSNFEDIAGVVLKESINFIGIRKVKITYYVHNRGLNGREYSNLQIGENAYLNIVLALIGVNDVDKTNTSMYKMKQGKNARVFREYTGVRNVNVDTEYETRYPEADKLKTVEIDVSSISGHHYVGVGFSGENKFNDSARIPHYDRNYCRAKCVITNIEIFA